jgi:hypothetical protein
MFSAIDLLSTTDAWLERLRKRTPLIEKKKIQFPQPKKCAVVQSERQSPQVILLSSPTSSVCTYRLPAYLI